MPYFRAKAGMPKWVSYARTAAYAAFRVADVRAGRGRPAPGWSVASADGTPTTLPIKTDTHAIPRLTVMATPPGCSPPRVDPRRSDLAGRDSADSASRGIAGAGPRVPSRPPCVTVWPAPLRDPTSNADTRRRRWRRASGAWPTTRTGAETPRKPRPDESPQTVRTCRAAPARGGRAARSCHGAI